jgi:hypothetical protein
MAFRDRVLLIYGLMWTFGTYLLNGSETTPGVVLFLVLLTLGLFTLALMASEDQKTGQLQAPDFVKPAVFADTHI